MRLLVLPAQRKFRGQCQKQKLQSSQAVITGLHGCMGMRSIQVYMRGCWRNISLCLILQRRFLCPPPPVPPPPPKPTLAKIPIDIRRMYQKNNFDIDLSGLFDGTLTQRVTPGYGQILNPYEAVYEFPESLQAVIYKFRFYDGEGSYNTPLRIYGMAADYTRTLLAEFKGENYMSWTEVNVTNPVQYKWMVLVITYEWGAHTLPTELELWGTFNELYKEPPIRSLHHHLSRTSSG
jgi:hypothetical protein